MKKKYFCKSSYVEFKLENKYKLSNLLRYKYGMGMIINWEVESLDKNNMNFS